MNPYGQYGRGENLMTGEMVFTGVSYKAFAYMRLFNDNYLELLRDVLIRSQNGFFMQFLLLSDDIWAFRDTIVQPIIMHPGPYSVDPNANK